MLFLPDLIPKALEELASRKDEDAQMVKEEEEWKAKVLCSSRHAMVQAFLLIHQS